MRRAFFVPERFFFESRRSALDALLTLVLTRRLGSMAAWRAISSVPSLIALDA